MTRASQPIDTIFKFKVDRMKKLFSLLKHLFSFALVFCLVLLSIPKTVFASGFMPPVVPSPGNLSFLPDFLTTVMVQDMANNGVFMTNSEASNAMRILNGRTIAESMTTNYYSISTAPWKNDIEVPFWNSNGVEVFPDNVIIAFVNSDAGVCSYCYDSTTGEILRQGVTFQDSKSTILGGSDIRYDPAGNEVNSMDLVVESCDLIKEQNLTFFDPSIPDTYKEHIINHDFCGVFQAVGTGRVYFVPDGCSSECVILPYDYNYNYEASGGVGFFPATPEFYCNDFSDIVLSGYIDQPTQNYFKTVNTNIYGSFYRYTGHYTGGFNEMYGGGYILWKAPTQQEYNAMKDIEKWNVSPATLNNYNGLVSYDDTLNNSPTYTRIYNENYDYSNPITTNNYPVYYDVSYPSYSPINNNYYENIYNYYSNTDPGTGGDIGNLPEGTLPDNIPILSNLQNRFPFSIPWDIYNLVSGLAVERETPYINRDIYIPVVDMTYHIEYDLSDFDEIASLFRTLFLISFIIGLAWFSYDHFFGS